MKKTLPIIILVMAVGAGSFYGGMMYKKSKSAGSGEQGDFSQLDFQRMRNFSPEERQEMMQGFRADAGDGTHQAGSMGMMDSAGFVRGEIISADDQSATVKLRDGGSKIILFSGSTGITKTASSSADELKEGELIMATGEQNSDGSFTAKIIQINPGR